jgi:hypothetical protein
MSGTDVNIVVIDSRKDIERLSAGYPATFLFYVPDCNTGAVLPDSPVVSNPANS